MDELEAEWEHHIAEAARRARASGRGDVAEYLTLRATNDMARRIAIEWLLETFNACAGEANRRGACIETTHDETHRFRVAQATMVGPRLRLRTGVRAITIEAGWPRTPRDGIVRGGGLACAHLKHFGDRGADAELLLVQHSDHTPQWVILNSNGTRTQFEEAHVHHHINKLLA